MTAPYVYNLFGARAPLRWPGRFAAGSSTAIDKGEMLEFTGTGNTLWVPMDSDFDMSAALGSGGKMSFAECDIVTGDLAGYYPVVAPIPGDVFELDLLASDAQTPAFGTAVYFSTSTKVTTTAGTNILGNVASKDHYPQLQGFFSEGDTKDRGTTIRSLSGGKVQFCVERTNSLIYAMQAN